MIFHRNCRVNSKNVHTALVRTQVQLTGTERHSLHVERDPRNSPAPNVTPCMMDAIHEASALVVPKLFVMSM